MLTRRRGAIAGCLLPNVPRAIEASGITKASGVACRGTAAVVHALGGADSVSALYSHSRFSCSHADSHAFANDSTASKLFHIESPKDRSTDFGDSGFER